MKIKILLGAVGLCSACGMALGQNASPAPQPASAPPAAGQTTSSAAASAPALTFTEAQTIVVAHRKYVAHPTPAKSGTTLAVAGFQMPAPPPTPPAETKPASTVEGYVWVPGHYMPVKGEWRWVRGEWAEPATPTSVWIPAQYDEKKKQWTPGYWQPDRPAEADASGGYR